MSQNAPRSSAAALLDEAAGRSADRAGLGRRLSTAPAPYLWGALRNPALSEREMVFLLRNHRAPAELLARIGGDRRWIRYHEIRRALVRHPRTPLVLARKLLGHLFWNELAEVACSPSTQPVLKRQAESRLAQHLEDLASGERVALARRAPRRLVVALSRSSDERVLGALLSNALTTEGDVVRIVQNPQLGGAFLARIAAHHEWGARRGVRLALLRNPRTPVPTALGALRRLDLGDLRRLGNDATVPRIVRIGAERVLGSTSERLTPPGLS